MNIKWFLTHLANCSVFKSLLRKKCCVSIHSVWVQEFLARKGKKRSPAGNIHPFYSYFLCLWLPKCLVEMAISLLLLVLLQIKDRRIEVKIWKCACLKSYVPGKKRDRWADGETQCSDLCEEHSDAQTLWKTNLLFRSLNYALFNCPKLS